MVSKPYTIICAFVHSFIQLLKVHMKLRSLFKKVPFDSSSISVNSDKCGVDLAVGCPSIPDRVDASHF